MKKQDLLFSSPMKSVREFVFDSQVAEVFDNMVSRSVPLYQDIQLATVKLCARLARDGTRIYDLGCSTGTTLFLLAQQLGDRNVQIVGVDNSAPMLAQCKKKLNGLNTVRNVAFVEADLQDFVPEPASVVILNYTLQFLPLSERPRLLKSVFDCLQPTGALLVSEKVSHRSVSLHQVLYEMHHDFKRSHGYSELEISQKRDALENVLVPITCEENLELLKSAGFEETEVYAKWYNFASFVAFKK